MEKSRERERERDRETERERERGRERERRGGHRERIATHICISKQGYVCIYVYTYIYIEYRGMHMRTVISVKGFREQGLGFRLDAASPPNDSQMMYKISLCKPKP